MSVTNSGLAFWRTLLRSRDKLRIRQRSFRVKKPFLTPTNEAYISKKHYSFHFHVIHSRSNSQQLLLGARSFSSDTAATLLCNVFSSFDWFAVRRRRLGILCYTLLGVFDVLGQTEGCCCRNYGLGSAQTPIWGFCWVISPR